MTIFPWTLGSAVAFEMRVVPNAFVFTSTYSKSTQTIDFLGERWYAKVDLAGATDYVVGAQREAFFDRLRGPVNLIALWHLRRPVPQGTMRAATVSTPVPQLSNTATLQATSGATLRAGDHLGFGVGGQLVRVMADVVADGNGLITPEFLPRARTGIPAGTVIVWNQPTANFLLKADGVPITWRPGELDGASLELIESP